MENDASRPPRPEELPQLVAQAVAVEYLKYRDAAERKPDEKKPTWLKLSDSAGFVALITVVLGTIAGGYLTTKFQEHAKKREEAVAQARLDSDRKLAAFKEHLDRERTVVTEMFSTLGKFVDASRDLTTLSRKEFCEDCPHAALSKDTVAKKKEVVKRYEQATIEWNANRLRLGMLLQLEHNSDETLLARWRETCDAAEAYAECADRWRTKHNDLEFHEALQACGPPRDALDKALQTFTQRIVVLRSSWITDTTDVQKRAAGTASVPSESH